jgi:hypothetical protein
MVLWPVRSSLMLLAAMSSPAHVMMRSIRTVVLIILFLFLTIAPPFAYHSFFLNNFYKVKNVICNAYLKNDFDYTMLSIVMFNIIL